MAPSARTVRPALEVESEPLGALLEAHRDDASRFVRPPLETRGHPPQAARGRGTRRIFSLESFGTAEVE